MQLVVKRKCGNIVSLRINNHFNTALINKYLLNNIKLILFSASFYYKITKMSNLTFRNLNPYEMHKHLMSKIERNQLKAKTDMDVIKENHQFLWDGDNEPDTWEKQLAKRYYVKLYKEYCICDLSRYKENKVALRWRIENEVVTGKGQFICGNKICQEKDNLFSWEVNFLYVEHNQKKNALVKVRLCPSCSKKLNAHSQKRLVKRNKRRKDLSRDNSESYNRRNAESDQNTDIESQPGSSKIIDSGHTLNKDTTESSEFEKEKNLWAAKDVPVEDKSREEEFNEYLEDLLL